MQSNKHKRKKEKPELSWQTGPYSRKQQYRFILPYGFLMLCRLWEVEPETVLVDFMDNLSFGSWKREGREAAKASLANYILEMGYGRLYYSPGDIQTMFKELDALGMLFPHDGNSKLLDAYVQWRDLHYAAWFNNWFGKVRRQLYYNKPSTDV